MKIAVSSTGNLLESPMDSRFGRCKYIALYDTENSVLEFIPNPNAEADSGAGPATAQLIASMDVGMVVSGHFGGKVKHILDDLKIEMVTVDTTMKTVKEIIKNL